MAFFLPHNGVKATLEQIHHDSWINSHNNVGLLNSDSSQIHCASASYTLGVVVL